MNIFIRVDASNEIGSGHLMRCLTLANALKSTDKKITFLSRSLPDSMKSFIEDAGHHFIGLSKLKRNLFSEDIYLSWLGVTKMEDAADSLNAIGALSCDWLIVDHYALDAEWELLMRTKAKRIFSIDDLANRPHECDILLDQNLYLNSEERYQNLVPSNAKLLLGTKFTLLRPEFMEERETSRVRDFKVRNILVFLGGADDHNITLKVLQTIENCINTDILVNIVLGAMHTSQDELIKRFNTPNYRLYLRAKNMAMLMAQADLAIGGGGTATWERCSVGLPTIPIILANNQKQLIHDGLACGIFVPGTGNIEEMFGPRNGLKESILYALANPDHLADISKRCMDLVDAKGIERVISEIKNFSSEVTIRRATLDDADELFSWRNHETIRAASHTSHLINYEEHIAWMTRTLKDSKYILLIGEFAGSDIGVVRFDLEADFNSEISIYLNPLKDLSGTGHKLLKSAEEYLYKHYPTINMIKAVFLSENVRSEQFFMQNGYIKVNNSTLVKRLNNE